MRHHQVIIFSGTQGTGSGAERVLEYFLQGTAHCSERFRIIAPEGSNIAAVARELGYDWVPWTARKNSLSENTRAFFALVRKHRRGSFGNVVHAWHTRGFEWGWAMGKYWRIPCSGTLHDDPSHGQFGSLRKRIIRASAARLDGVGAVSQALIDQCGNLQWKRPLALLRNGLPDAPPVPGNLTTPLRVGFLASGSLWKGTALLPSIIAETQDLPLEWNLYGDASAETSSILQELAKYPKVRHCGKRSVDEIFANIDLLLHLSVEFDPFPTVLLEAARAGRPAIATRVGGAPEIVEDGRTGFLVPPGDPGAVVRTLRDIVLNTALRIELGQAARARFAQNFRVEQMVADYQRFWDRLAFPHS